LDFDTTPGNRGRQEPGSFGKSEVRSDRRLPFGTTGASRQRRPEDDRAAFTIPAGARKAALVHLALAAWRAGELNPRELGQVRGRDVDEAGFQRALYRSSMGEIEHVLRPILGGRRVRVQGQLAGAGRSALERLGADVEELRPEGENRYIDMTPAIFVVAALAMAVRYVSLGLDDQDLYILVGMVFALMYGLRPFFSKMQRPRD
jgi:hypothetical protein